MWNTSNHRIHIPKQTQDIKYLSERDFHSSQTILMINMTTGGMQKAVLVKEIGKPVQLGERSIPALGKGQVLLRVTATMSMSRFPYVFEH